MDTSLSLSDIGKDPIPFSTGEFAKQANGSVSVSCGDTVVLATACMSKEPKEPKEGIGFLPLFVDYQERTYAVGKIPGGFFKREGRPKDIEILTSRLIDRPIRPLFPEGLTHELQVIAMVLSSDGKNDPDVIAINGVSCALTISDIPFNGPIGAVRVALAQDEFIINPTYEERQSSDLDLVVVGRDDSVLMLEGKFSQIDEKIIIDAIKFAHPFIKKIISLQKK
ncbi:MAG: polyribonucleotide nucleotidyltransferase, partial [Candidatus Omnitrophota bacterium]